MESNPQYSREKADFIFAKVQRYYDKEAYHLALSEIESNRELLGSLLNMGSQLKLNKIFSKSIVSVMLDSFEVDGNISEYNSLFSENRTMLELHTERKTFELLNKYLIEKESNPHYKSRQERYCKEAPVDDSIFPYDEVSQIVIKTSPKKTADALDIERDFLDSIASPTFYYGQLSEEEMNQSGEVLKSNVDKKAIHEDFFNSIRQPGFSSSDNSDEFEQIEFEGLRDSQNINCSSSEVLEEDSVEKIKEKIKVLEEKRVSSVIGPKPKREPVKREKPKKHNFSGKVEEFTIELPNDEPVSERVAKEEVAEETIKEYKPQVKSMFDEDSPIFDDEYDEEYEEGYDGDETDDGIEVTLQEVSEKIKDTVSKISTKVQVAVEQNIQKAQESSKNSSNNSKKSRKNNNKKSTNFSESKKSNQGVPNKKKEIKPKVNYERKENTSKYVEKKPVAEKVSDSRYSETLKSKNAGQKDIFINKNIYIFLIVLILIVGGAFFINSMKSKNKNANNTQQSNNQQNNANGNAGGTTESGETGNGNSGGQSQQKDNNTTGDQNKETLESEYILPMSDERLLNDEDVAGLTKAQVRLALNEIFAKHGWNFGGDGELFEYYSGKSWYKPDMQMQTSAGAEKKFSEIEAQNVQFLAQKFNSM